MDANRHGAQEKSGLLYNHPMLCLGVPLCYSFSLLKGMNSQKGGNLAALHGPEHPPISMHETDSLRETLKVYFVACASQRGTVTVKTYPVKQNLTALGLSAPAT